MPIVRNRFSLSKFFSNVSQAMNCCTIRSNGQVVPVEDTGISFQGNSLSSRSHYLTDYIAEFIGGSKTKDLLEFTVNVQMEFAPTTDTSSLLMSSLCNVQYTSGDLSN